MVFDQLQEKEFVVFFFLGHFFHAGVVLGDAEFVEHIPHIEVFDDVTAFEPSGEVVGQEKADEEAA